MATTYNNLYMDIRQTLRRAGIEAATLEARELMCFASGKTRSQLVQDGQLYVPPAIEERAKDLVRRHLAGEPVAYLIGEWKLACILDSLAVDKVLPEGLLHQHIAAVFFILQDAADAVDGPLR